jgi:hypothetical protein
MGVQADLFQDTIELIESKNIKKLSEVRTQISREEAYDFIEKLLWNFDNVKRDRPQDEEEND